jgi:hypothetical protein
LAKRAHKGARYLEIFYLPSICHPFAIHLPWPFAIGFLLFAMHILLILKENDQSWFHLRIKRMCMANRRKPMANGHGKWMANGWQMDGK